MTSGVTIFLTGAAALLMLSLVSWIVGKFVNRLNHLTLVNRPPTSELMMTGFFWIMFALGVSVFTYLTGFIIIVVIRP